MAVVKRGAVQAPTVSKETVEVEALGGEVVVRGLMLSERISLEQRIASAQRLAKEAAAQHVGQEPALNAGVNATIPILLAAAVLDADGVQLWTEQEWQVFGGKHPGQAVALFNVAWRLAGLNSGDASKN